MGRAAELAMLDSLLAPDGPRVVHVSGAGGIGKSSLLDAFAARARERGATVVRIDCRTVEPSEPGLFGALAVATGAAGPTLDEVAGRLEALGAPVLLAFDTYELFWLMDTYIRQQMCPLLSDVVRIVTAGRDAPQGPWLTSPEWQGLFKALSLGPLAEHEAVAHLEGAGVDGAAARRINAVVRGHPLAPAVSAGLGAGTGAGRVEDAAVGAVVDTLARRYLAEVADPAAREALEAACVVRRTTESLLRAMLPGCAPRYILDRLRDLPFVESAADGLFVHDAVRDAIATGLLATDPELHRQYRVRAWHQLRQEVKHASRESLWRYTADILYLLRKPEIREGFFPSGFHPLAVEPARPGDEAHVEAIAAAWLGPDMLEAVRAWWRHAPGSFFMTRSPDGGTPGFYILSRASRIKEDIIAADPITAAWADDLRRHRDPAQALLIRLWLDRELGSRTSATQGAIGLDAKRTYMEMRPNLRYIYLCGTDGDNLAWCDALHFHDEPEAERTVDRRIYRTKVLDMGPGSVDSWLAGLVADDLGIDESERDQDLYVPGSQELQLPGGPVPLTPLEAGVMDALYARAGRPVSRADLVEQVWGYRSEATSNVVDAVVAGIRRKLSDHAGVLETVRGTGYRLRA